MTGRGTLLHRTLSKSFVCSFADNPEDGDSCPFARAQEGRRLISTYSSGQGESGILPFSSTIHFQPLPRNLNCNLGSEGGLKTNSEPSQLDRNCAMVPLRPGCLSQDGGREKEDQGHLSPSSEEGVEVGQEGGHGLFDREPAHAGSLRSPRF